MIRWQATVNCRTDNGTADVIYHLSEISDLHYLVERGPHWDTIEKIEIVRVNHVSSKTLTVEQAEKM